jgi:hypothetical protein
LALQRGFSTKRPVDKLNYNTELSLSSDDSDEHVAFQQVTSNDLKEFKEPPKRVKMLVRDFIEDSLYNPNYGYFPKQATIFTSADTTLDFSKIRDSNEFQAMIAEKYAGYGVDGVGPGRQIFHTPTEMFKVSSLVNHFVPKHLKYVLTALVRTSHREMFGLGILVEILSL